jgi:hypothetical protein
MYLTSLSKRPRVSFALIILLLAERSCKPSLKIFTEKYGGPENVYCYKKILKSLKYHLEKNRQPGWMADFDTSAGYYKI